VTQGVPHGSSKPHRSRQLCGRHARHDKSAPARRGVQACRAQRPSPHAFASRQGRAAAGELRAARHGCSRCGGRRAAAPAAVAGNLGIWPQRCSWLATRRWVFWWCGGRWWGKVPGLGVAGGCVGRARGVREEREEGQGKSVRDCGWGGV
jgi:hypothetical protein